METSTRVSVGVFTAVALITIALVGAQATVFAHNGSSNPTTTYTINSLTCLIPKDYLSYASVIHLLPLVTTSPRFLNLTDGLPFVFGNAENITDRTQQIGNQPPVHLPDAVEMVFYSTGLTTYCGMFLNKAQNVIDVQVPVQNGGFNLTEATYNTLTPV